MVNEERGQIRQFQKKERFLSFTILISYLWLLFAPISILFSQPVTVPDFVAPQVSNQNLNQYVSLANQSHSLKAWNMIVDQGFGVIKASWEDLASQEITALESSVNSQYANDPATAAYIDKMIESQASNSEQAWLTQIETQIADGQNTFLQSLQTSSLTQTGQTDSNYQTVLTNGLQTFSDSLNSLQQNYQNQLASINKTDAQYQANLQQLQTYENAVRTSISTSVTQLDSSLQNTALYYNKNADGSVNWSSLNRSGIGLQTLISNLYQGLQNGTSLSTLATEMTSYLQTQETQAVQNANYWTQQSQAYTQTNSNIATGFADYQLSGFQSLVDYANSVRSSNTAINAIMTYIDGGSNSQDSTLLNFLYSTYGYDPTKTQIVGITNADFTGINQGYHSYSPFPITLGHSGAGLSYSSSGLSAFDFSATGLWAFGLFLPVTAYFTEDTFSYSINFQVKDLTAGANAQTWNGFASSLNSELGTWNTLAPSISNWEGQMSAYQAQYAAWHAQAVAYENNLQISYSNGVQTLNSEKVSWLSGINSQASVASSSVQTAKIEDDSNAQVKLDDSLPRISSVFLPSSGEVLAPALTPPSVDSSGLNNVLSIFQQSLMGASNLALENQLNKQAIQEKQNAVNQIASSLGSNAVVDNHGNITYTTAIEDGHAKLKAGGDATNSSDYEATKVNQYVYVGAPATIRVASAGNLFQSWNSDSVLSENQTNEDSFNASYNTAINTLNSQIKSLNEQNAKNDLAFQNEAQAEASFATNEQSLAKTMLQGGTFQSWVQGQIKDKVNAAVATALANATGMSPDMASQLVSWFEKKQADKKAKAEARTQEITAGITTVASIALSFVAGPEMLALGQAALQAVQGYQNGGMEGALVGAASGAATGYARQFGVNVGVSYSYSGGFGGTLGLGSSSLNGGVTFSQHGSTSFSLGTKAGNLNYNPQSGFSGSVNVWGTEGGQGLMVNVGQHTGPSLTYQNTDEESGVGGSVTIDGKGNATVAATYRNATVVSATGNVHDPSSFGNLTLNNNFNNDLNQNLAMKQADANSKAADSKLNAGRNAIAETGNPDQKEILNNPNASAEDQHGVLATLAKSNDFLTDPSSASSWLGRTTQDLAGNLLGSMGLRASDSNGFIDEKGNYHQRTCFTGETLIRTREGLKRIDKIEIGDFVLSLNEKTGKVSYKKVTELFVHEVKLIHRVSYKNGPVINSTWNHPFYLRGKGWTEVKDIQAGERSVTIASIRNSEKGNLASRTPIAASLASLKNQNSNEEYSDSWKNESAGTLEISKIEEVYTETKVYNIEVEDNHTYFVGKDGILVHNYLPEFVDQLNQRVAEIKGAINEPVGTAKAVAEQQFSKEGLQRTAIDAVTLGQGRNIENLVNATGVNGEEAAARAHANFAFDGVLGLATEGVGRLISGVRGLTGAASEASNAGKIGSLTARQTETLTTTSDYLNLLDKGDRNSLMKQIGDLSKTAEGRQKIADIHKVVNNLLYHAEIKQGFVNPVNVSVSKLKELQTLTGVLKDTIHNP